MGNGCYIIGAPMDDYKRNALVLIASPCSHLHFTDKDKKTCGTDE